MQINHDVITDGRLNLNPGHHFDTSQESAINEHIPKRISYKNGKPQI